jgi:predicted secreted protein
MNVHLRRLVLRRTGLRMATASVALLLSVARTGRADDGIVVLSTGSASARPAEVEISARLTGEAELAADAVVKFRDAKKRALAAIAALKNPDLTVIPGGVSVASGMDANAQMMAMRGMSVPTTTQKVRLLETSRIVLTHADKVEGEELIEKLLKILDVAKDAGYQIGPAATTNYYEMQMRAAEGDEGNSIVAFKLPDSSVLREKAYTAAIDDAKAKAQKLAELSGAKLGRIVSVQETEATQKQDAGSSVMMMIYGIASNKRSNDEKSLVSATSGEVTLRINLRVQFEMAK